MKHEWRKQEKAFYLPKNKPELLDIPKYTFITLSGKGNPNDDFFSEYIGVLYSVAYAIKMNLKKSKNPPKDYQDWAVYPLEGVWDIAKDAQQNSDKSINKDDLVFDLMIRQPNFVGEDFFNEMIEITKNRKPHQLLSEVKFKTITEGKCIQMLHIGSYDDEPQSFQKMERFATELNLRRKSKIHREIYLSDVRKVEVEKLKTVLRFQVEV
ncbi:MAG: hypothetical protein CSA36_06825 [Draconibacterium sp.]|nr:MAG: hypothetical protein CSA36_06825 [Draconibacterium sp.]